MAKPARKTHPQAPLYFGAPLPVNAISSDSVTQHQDELSIAFSQLTAVPTTLAGHSITDAYTKTEVDASQAAQDAVTATKAPLASPALTGTPTAPTPAPGDNSTKLATTAFVAAAVVGVSGYTPARATSAITTGSLAASATDSSKVAAIGKSGVLLRVHTDRPARVRLYATAAALTADATRAVGTDPTGEHGVLLDLVTTASTLDFYLSPAVSYASDEAVPVSNLALAVQNLDTITATVTATFTFVPLEA